MQNNKKIKLPGGRRFSSKQKKISQSNPISIVFGLHEFGLGLGETRPH